MTTPRRNRGRLPNPWKLEHRELVALCYRLDPSVGDYLEFSPKELAQIVDCWRHAPSAAEAKRRADVDIRAFRMYAKVEEATREELIAFCLWNDPNGCYTDEEAIAEYGKRHDTEQYREIIRIWAQEDTEVGQTT